jgi:hypothetical protein
MSHFARGTCCAVAFVLGLVLTSHMSAEEHADTPDAKHKRASFREVAEERIQTVLREPLKAPLEHTEVPLEEVIDILQEDYGIPIVFDNAALDEVAISPETEITVSLRHITLRSALNHLFKQPGVEDLTYVIDDEVLLITTIERAGATLTIRMHRVDDLDLFGGSSGGFGVAEKGMGMESGGSSGGRGGGRGGVSTHPQVYSSLIEAIVSCVENDSWKANGTGEGELVLVKPGILIVSTTRVVQDKVERLLDQKRGAKTRIEQK